MLTWETPESDGGSPITGYHVKRRMTTSSHWVTITKNALSDLVVHVKDLMEDSEYQYQVCAVNKIGEGPFGSPCAPFVTKDPFSK